MCVDSENVKFTHPTFSSNEMTSNRTYVFPIKLFFLSGIGWEVGNWICSRFGCDQKKDQLNRATTGHTKAPWDDFTLEGFSQPWPCFYCKPGHNNRLRCFAPCCKMALARFKVVAHFISLVHFMISLLFFNKEVISKLYLVWCL